MIVAASADSPCLALNGLNEERSDILAVLVEDTLESSNIVVADASLLAHAGSLRSHEGSEGAKLATRLGVSRHGDDGDAVDAR